MERDCQHGLYKAGMGSSRVLSDFAEKYGSKNRVLAGFGIGGKSGKEKDSPPQDPVMVVSLQMKLDHTSRARNESASFKYKEIIVPKGSEIWRSSRNNRLKIWSGIATRDHV
ncbi:hypothetical protein Tco_1314242 [Tanacetum coccineum]